MIVTPDFVYVHYPKTGGSFVTAKVGELYPPVRGLPGAVERFARRTARGAWPQRSRAASALYLRTLGYLELNKHGSCSQIPACFAGRPLVTTVRNPFDRYVSMFEFPLWRAESEPYLQRSALAGLLPGFPDVTFEEFATVVSDHRGPWCAPSPVARRLGFETRDFIFHFCKEPGATIDRLLRRDPREAAEIIREDLHDVVFLRTEHLNADLAEYLGRFGHGEVQLERIRGAAKVWPREGGRDAEASWRPYYSEALLAHVRHLDGVLFELFPEYDVSGAASVD